MRILLTVHHELDRNSGAPGAAIALAEAIRESGHNVDLLSHDDLPQWARGRPALAIFPLLVFWRSIRGRRYYDILDYLSCDGWLTTLLPRKWRPRVLAAYTQGLEHLAHARLIEDARVGRGKAPSWKYHLFRGTIQLWTVSRAIRGADLVFLLNRFERAFVCDRPRSWKEPERVSLTFNGVSPEMMTVSMPAEPADNSPLGLAFVGTFIDRKGIAYLIPALEIHLERYEQAIASLVGTQVPSDQILKKIKSTVRDRIRVVPRYDRKELAVLLAHSHVLVLPSLAEGFSLAFIEAMNIGLVPVVTRGHGFEEAVVDGISGMLIDRGSSEQIVLALDRLERDRAMWRRMRAEAISTARQFTWARAASLRLKGYQAATAQPA